MDDSILTLLFYIGILVLVSVSKFFSKLLKNKKNDSVFQTENIVEEPENGWSNLSFQEEDIHHKQDETRTAFSSYESPFEAFKEEGASAFTPINHSPIETVSSESDFYYSSVENDENLLSLLADFDARTAIIYSEILKRPEY